MKFTQLTNLYDKIESFIERLPGPLQQPILREIRPIRSIFLSQRPPRLAAFGSTSVTLPSLVNALFSTDISCSRTEMPRWRECSLAGRGTLRLLDARTALAPEALAAEPADVFLFVRSAVEPADSLPGQLDRLVESLAGDASVIGLVIHEPGEAGDVARGQLDAALRSHPAIADRLAATLAASTTAHFKIDGTLDESRDERVGIDRLAHRITDELPDAAKLEMARLSGVREVQLEMAQTLIKSVSAICAAIGAQPIPLADMPILTGLQAAMVGGVIYISGQPARPKLVAQFIAAMGANYGAALLLREGSRAALKFLPLWGNAVSGAIAGAGTFAIGRAASAHFIEGATMREARDLFRRFRKKKPPQLRDRDS